MSQPEFSLRCRYYALVVLTGVNIFSYMDRLLIAVLIEPIKAERQISDFLMDTIVGLAFASTYVIFGFPMARIADRGIRVKLISLSITFWSLMTVICGAVTNALQMFVVRLRGSRRGGRTASRSGAGCRVFPSGECNVPMHGVSGPGGLRQSWWVWHAHPLTERSEVARPAGFEPAT